MNLTTFMNQGIKNLLTTMNRYYIKDREGRAFLSHILPYIQKSADIRNSYEKRGTHIPPFLIASIASQCNLHCSGCYARASGACSSDPAKSDLSAARWKAIFTEAAQLGIPFILLAGGEPFMRRDVIEAAAQSRDVVFPVFTNGTMMDDDTLALLDRNRNVIPVFSIEGAAVETDRRRGEGTCAMVHEAMNRLRERGVLFGASITVTKENIHIVTEPSFIFELRNRGCGLIFFVEYVPVSEGTEQLSLSHDDLNTLTDSVSELKKSMDDMIILSFPGDEAAMGGCLASGRGFFHINASGGAEPCPFSPYAKYNLKTSSILDVLKSDYFAQLREIAKHAGAHTGGCTLFEQRDKVLALNQPID